MTNVKTCQVCLGERQECLGERGAYGNFGDVEDGSEGLVMGDRGVVGDRHDGGLHEVAGLSVFTLPPVMILPPCINFNLI